MIRLSLHAQEWIERRSLSLQWIEAAVEHPDRRMPDPRTPGLTRSYKSIREAGGRVLRVVHRPEGNDVLIVTAHFDRGAKR